MVNFSLTRFLLIDKSYFVQINGTLPVSSIQILALFSWSLLPTRLFGVYPEDCNLSCHCCDSWQLYSVTLRDITLKQYCTWGRPNKRHHFQAVLHHEETTIKFEYSGTGAGFLQLVWFPLLILIPATAPYSLIELYLTLYGMHTDSIIK